MSRAYVLIACIGINLYALEEFSGAEERPRGAPIIENRSGQTLQVGTQTRQGNIEWVDAKDRKQTLLPASANQIVSFTLRKTQRERLEVILYEQTPSGKEYPLAVLPFSGDYIEIPTTILRPDRAIIEIMSR